MFLSNHQEIKIGGKAPLFTSFAIALGLILFALANLAPDDSPAWLGFWGYLDSTRIYNGELWSYITTSFLHVNILHLAFNLSWVWALGRMLERHLGTLNMLIFWLVAAFVSSGCQFIISGNSGIGASGVVYALFGYEFIARNKVAEFRQILTSQTNMILIAWLFICIVLTETGALNVANGAHFSGFIFGVITGWLVEIKQKPGLSLVAAIIALGLTIAGTLYAPWSDHWNYHHGVQAYEKRDYASAIQHFSRIQPKSDDFPFAIALRAQSKYDSGNKRGALGDLELALLHRNDELVPRSEQLNQLAWLYATDPDPQYQNFPRALEYAIEANQLSNSRNAHILDTLAVAYAANGQFEEAIQWQEKAVAIAKQENDLEFLPVYESKLELFRNQQPYFEEENGGSTGT